MLDCVREREKTRPLSYNLILSEEDFVPPPPEICLGCPTNIPVDSPDLEEALNHSIAKLNAENNQTFYFKIDKVTKATAQVCKLCYKNSDIIIYVQIAY